MPVYTRPEFAEACGVTQSYVNNYISRKKIIVNKDNKIDTSDPYNKLFFDKRQGVKKESKKKVERKRKLEELPKESDPVSTESTTNFNLDRLKKEAELEKAELDIELKKVELAKKSGEVIPTDLVKNVIKNHVKSITLKFHQAADNYLSEISNETGMKGERLAYWRGALIDQINEASVEAVEESKKDVEHIVQEYSQKRGVGQKK